MTSTRLETQAADAFVPEPDAATLWVERMARRFYRSPDDVRDLVSRTVGLMDPGSDAQTDADYRLRVLRIMRGLVLDRCAFDRELG
ncbi:hypothetical protein ASG25_07690 [Rhizobium sp. Leaf384]|uniref:hypothetical protein n=1 Tax=unclassified Rhizobium TaxID=2613769 RepID=UPI0007125E7B|nr:MULTISPECIES: hypothetical protein [unclassified Rhizobium]KQS81336.1 hypothetical protein ASG25_07690 [Rhizobium sp. Leaf384]KQS87245.1 hypothetical protein ASG58_03250 [Rhizobium sp. Leaf383]